MFSVGDKVFYYGIEPHGITGVIASECLAGDMYFVQFPDRLVRLGAAELHPARQLDQDVHEMNWQELQDEVMKLRGGLRYILQQEGDDLCYRDFYEVAARCLPEVNDLSNLRTLPPPRVMLGNCSRFVDSLCGGKLYQRLGEPALTPETAQRQPI